MKETKVRGKRGEWKNVASSGLEGFSPKQIQMVERISGIGVAHQRNFGELLSNFPNDFQIPAGFDFDFNALVARLQLLFNFLQQLSHAILNSKGYATVNGLSFSTQELIQRLLPLPCV